jgi:tocopherol cyclase
MGLLTKIKNPELFQGSLGRRGYFEGWYFKLIGADRATAAAVIPGISLGSGQHHPESHAFIQFIWADRTLYFRYPLSDFSSDSRRFLVKIGENTFSRDGITLRLKQGDDRIEGVLKFSEVLPFPRTLLYPGIMGPFGYVPGMECYHGIVNIRHSIAGTLSVSGTPICFDGGSGYVEKDWGRAFPSAWVWLQANHFSDDAAFLFSVADIPWQGGSFRGFISFLYLNGRLHRFATYTGAKLVKLSEAGDTTEAVMTGRSGTLELSARTGPGGMLRAPKNGLMDRLIEESISATISVKLSDAKGRVLFEGTSPCAGMERYDSQKLMTSAHP